MGRPNKQQRELSEPGICTACGADCPAGRNTAGHCCACHRLDYAEYKRLMAKRLEAQRSKGREYWQGRGIAVGAKMQAFGRDMLCGMATMRMTGTAKAGLSGAYILGSDGQHYNPDYWSAV